MDASDRMEWLLLTVSTGKEAALRVFVWRQLHKLGAVYLHRSVCLLPDQPRIRTALKPVLRRISSQNGTVRLIPVSIAGADNEALVEEQRADRDAEYAEVVGRVPQFLAEIEMETTRGRATYVEVEESEADLERFEKWLSGIAERDYFQAALGPEARSAVLRCRAALAAFEDLAVAADTQPAEATVARPPLLRVVDDES